MLQRQETVEVATTGPAGAREFVRTTLTEWDGLDAIDEAVLLVSEVVTDAIVNGHAAATTIGVGVTDGALRVEVHDSGRGRQRLMTELRRDDPAAGLGILDAIASDWGVEVGVDVTLVWFVLDDRTRGTN